MKTIYKGVNCSVSKRKDNSIQVKVESFTNIFKTEHEALEHLAKTLSLEISTKNHHKNKLDAYVDAINTLKGY